MLGLVIAVGSYLIVKVKSDRRRSGLMLMVLILAVLFLTNNSVWNIIEKALALDKYQDATLNEFSSGRFVLWAKALQDWIEKPVFGTGAYYVFMRSDGKWYCGFCVAYDYPYF